MKNKDAFFFSGVTVATLLTLLGCETKVAASVPVATKLAIVGMIQSVQVRSTDTLVTVDVDSVPKVFDGIGNTAVHKGSVIVVDFRGIPQNYWNGSVENYLPVDKGLEITTVITYQSSGDGGKWTSLFDSYVYKKDGFFWNWKGQNFGANVFG